MTPWPTQKYSFVAILRDEIDAGGSPLYGMVARKVAPAVVSALVAPAKKAQRDPAEFRPFSEVPEKDGVYEVKSPVCLGKYFSRYENGIWYANTSSIPSASKQGSETMAITTGYVTGWREIQEQGQ